MRGDNMNVAIGQTIRKNNIQMAKKIADTMTEETDDTKISAIAWNLGCTKNKARDYLELIKDVGG